MMYDMRNVNFVICTLLIFIIRVQFNLKQSNVSERFLLMILKDK